MLARDVSYSKRFTTAAAADPLYKCPAVFIGHPPDRPTDVERC